MSGLRSFASYGSTSMTQHRSSTEPWSAHIKMRRAEKGDPKQCFGTLSRRFFDQNPRDRRRERQAAPRHADTRRAARDDRRARIARLCERRRPHRRYRLRLQRASRRDQRTRHQGRHQFQARAEAEDPEGSRAVSNSIPRRGLLPHAQALSRNRDAIRQDALVLPRLRPRCMRVRMACHTLTYVVVVVVVDLDGDGDVEVDATFDATAGWRDRYLRHAPLSTRGEAMECAASL